MFKDQTSNDPVNKEAKMLLQRASWLNLPPEEFNYLVNGGEKPESVALTDQQELDRFTEKYCLERQYRKKAEKQVKSHKDHIKHLKKQIETLEMKCEALSSAFKDLA